MRIRRPASVRIGWSASTAMVLLASAMPAYAACDLTPTAGHSTYVCDSGTNAVVLTDTDGTNTLTMPAGGTGTINGDVTFGNFVDRVEIHSGTINGTISQSGGADVFIMTDGVIGALHQGSELDTATISGGHIIGRFYAGDFVTMTGGRIGNVDLEQANNQMRMSGGTIDTSIEAAQGNDLLEVSGTAAIGTFVNLGNGNNTFRWLGGGTIGGNIIMGNGQDTALLRGLTEASFAPGRTIDGGASTSIDTLTFEGTSSTSVARYINWETVNLTQGSTFTLNGNFVLGDALSNTGSFDIDASSTLFAGAGAHGAVRAFTPANAATLTNAGTIDLTNGAPSAADTFTVAGNYIGAAGFLRLDTVLGSDGSPSDKLVIQNGTGTGSTGIVVVKAGGAGALTTRDGILVVEATGTSTSTAGAFTLATPLAFGAHEYLLFRGGVSAGSQENWYLRSEFIDLGSLPTDPAAPVPGVPILRPETAVYSVLPPMARDLAMSTLGTFHERRGEQSFLSGGDNFSTSWGRVFGSSTEQSWSGTVSPSTDGTTFGIQAGLDMLRSETETGARNVAGMFLGYASLDADVRGAVLGQIDLAAGKLDLNAYSVGGYYTYVGAGGWYLDGVLMGTWFGGDARSDRAFGIDAAGRVVTASLEAGAPIALTEGWVLEPQAQIIWQDLSFDDGNDTLSAVRFDEGRSVTGRIGARLQGTFDTSSGQFKPYLKANFWHGFDGEDVTYFDSDAIKVETGGTRLELGAGITHAFTDKVSTFAVADHTFNLGGEHSRVFEGNVGLQVKW